MRPPVGIGPGGTSENSPPIHWRVPSPQNENRVPEGRLIPQNVISTQAKPAWVGDPLVLILADVLFQELPHDLGSNGDH